MSKSYTVPFDLCPCGKRGWHDERDAEKAMGRAKAKRNKALDATGSRRGLVRENRIYLCHASEMFHLTSQSRRENAAQRAQTVVAERTQSLPDNVVAMPTAWERWLAEQGKTVVTEAQEVAA